MIEMATSSKKQSKTQDVRAVDSEELSKLVKLAVADAIKEAFPKFVDDVVAQLSEKTQAIVAEQMSEVRNHISSIRTDISTCMEQIKASDSRVEEVDSRFSTSMDKLTAFCTKLENKIADLEDRSRRDNIRIHGVPENRETVNLLSFLSGSIPKWFPQLGSVEIMRAHRVGPERENANNKPLPRTVLLKLLRFTDRDKILAAARKTTIEVDGSAIRFSPDYSKQTFARRLAFSGVMDTLQKFGLRTFLLYPATLKVMHGGATHLFKSPQEAKQFAETLDS